MKKDLEILETSPLFAGLTRQELEALLPALRARHVRGDKGEYLLHAGEVIHSLGVVLSGAALVIQEDFWGSRSLLAALGPGSCFAETFACAPGVPLNVSVVCDAPTTALFLDVGELLAGRGGPGTGKLEQNLLREMARKNVAFSRKLTHLGQRTTRAKLLSYLSEESQRQGSHEFDIPFSRQQLADYLLVERSGLSQELSKMQAEGLLEFRKNHFLLKVLSHSGPDIV